MKASCPSCGGEVEFKSRVSTFGVCPYCSSMLVRHDMNIEAIGKMAELPGDISPLQIGTKGAHRGKSFEIVGRLKVAWADGGWNEWFLLMQDGSPAWIGEAQGFFSISYPDTTYKQSPKLDIFKPGVAMKFGGISYTVDDMKKAQCVGSEGELPFSGEVGRNSVSVDLTGYNGAYACVDISDEDGVLLFTGEYVDFDDFHFTGLREGAGGGIDDLDAKTVKGGKTFNCPSCAATLSVHAVGQTVSVVCASCGSTIDVTNENYSILSRAQEKMTVEPLIPIGSKGKLRGVPWEVIGFMTREDTEYEESWEEYLLFNAQKGFRWLTQYNGHWNYVLMTKNRPVVSSVSARYIGKDFRLFNKGVAKVTFVVGEFYWRVKVGETAETADYIDPPRVLTSEKNEEEIVWSLGEYIEPDDVAKAFNIKEMPPKIGIYMNQPAPPQTKSGTILKIYAAFLVLITMVQFGHLIVSQSKAIFKSEYTFHKDDPPGMINTPPFEIPGGDANAQVEIECTGLSNEWLDVDGTLVNDKTGEAIEFYKEIEYYSGSDSDGSWSEGEKKDDTVLSSVPGGTYHLSFRPSAALQGGQVEKHYSVTVKRDVPTWGNYLITLILLSLSPLVLLFTKSSFEIKRWAESDFSPSGSGADAEDATDQERVVLKKICLRCNKENDAERTHCAACNAPLPATAVSILKHD